MTTLENSYDSFVFSCSFCIIDIYRRACLRALKKNKPYDSLSYRLRLCPGEGIATQLSHSRGGQVQRSMAHPQPTAADPRLALLTPRGSTVSRRDDLAAAVHEEAWLYSLAPKHVPLLRYSS